MRYMSYSEMSMWRNKYIAKNGELEKARCIILDLLEDNSKLQYIQRIIKDDFINDSFKLEIIDEVIKG